MPGRVTYFLAFPDVIYLYDGKLPLNMDEISEYERLNFLNKVKTDKC